jgi:hypothetical protein
MTAGHVGRVETDAAVVAHFGQHGDEVALVAADLDHVLAAQVIAVDQILGQGAMELVERRGVPLRRLIASRVLRQGLVEGDVG